jgi:2,3-bisphosphoglycerate-independent phosphoglycerate mutase
MMKNEKGYIMRKPFILCILDGWGHSEKTEGNAIKAAHTPTWDRWMQTFPHSLLEASGEYVGLPHGQMGNSEVGHMAIGSGRIILQDLPRIDHAIQDGSLAHNPVLKNLIEKASNNHQSCHLLGLLSPGGVHSHEDHILALCEILNQHNISVKLHLFLDGRDTPPQSAKEFVGAFLEKIQPLTHVSIATIGGRFYGMDRDNRWDRTQQAYDAITIGKGAKFASPLEYIQSSYHQQIFDEFITPGVQENYTGMADGDVLLMANFRADRVRQILNALLVPEFDKFTPDKKIHFAATVGMTQYSEDLNHYITYLFPPEQIQDTLGAVIANKGMSQLRIAETEKYAHVTFFFNGGNDKPSDKESHVLVPSPKVRTYDLKPSMSAMEITETLLTHLHNFDLLVINYANADMVGHSGNFEAAIKAVETLDSCFAKLENAVFKANGILVVTADHGNVEAMIDEHTHQPHTAHSTNPVPFLVIGQSKCITLKPHGGLADVAPTVLDLMGIPKPKSMTGESLCQNG